MEEFVGTGELTRALASGATRSPDWARRVFGGRPVVAQLGAEAGRVGGHRHPTGRCCPLGGAGWETDATWRILLSEVPEGALWRHDPQTEDGGATPSPTGWATWSSWWARKARDGRSSPGSLVRGQRGCSGAASDRVRPHRRDHRGRVGHRRRAAAAQQKILEHVFGKVAARALVEEARRRLARSERVIETDGLRFATVVTDRTDGDTTAAEIRHGVAGVVG